MQVLPEISQFMDHIQSDARISPLHISLYMAIIHRWANQDFCNPVQVRARELMPQAKIGGVAPYHRCIKQLHDYGYIRYVPSCNPAIPSQVFLRERDTGGDLR